MNSSKLVILIWADKEIIVRYFLDNLSIWIADFQDSKKYLVESYACSTKFKSITDVQH